MKVLDVNDTPPKFSRSRYSSVVPENSVVDTLVSVFAYLQHFKKMPNYCVYLQHFKKMTKSCAYKHNFVERWNAF